MHGADWVVLTRGSEIRLYAARPDTGVGRKGRAETFVEANLICELDACVAHLYGLDEDDLAVLYGTFDAKRPDRYADHHARVLAHYRRWAESSTWS